MTFPLILNETTRAQIAAVRYERTPVYAATVVHPWRPWHMRVFGGSPIPVRLDPAGPFCRTRLYLGPSRAELGDAHRPAVDGIVNLCELNDPWPLSADDRRWPRGEGAQGYTWEALAADTHGVVALVRAGRTVLIHCMAGVNRSATLTCAVLMAVEGIGADAALRRVQRFHQPARPEERHWQALRQLELALAAAHGASADEQM